MDREKREKILGWILIVLVAILYFFANLQKVLIPGAVFDTLQQRYNVGAAEITRLGAGFMYAYSIFQLVVGLIADRYCGARAIAMGGIFFCAGSVISAFDMGLETLLVSRIATGIGASVVYLSMVKMVTRLSASAYTFILGIMVLVGYSGSVAGGVPFVAAVEYFGYTAVMLTIGALTTVVYLLFLANCAVTTLPPVCRDVKLNLTPYIASFKVRHNCCLWLTVAVGFSVFYSMQTVFGKKFLEDFAGMSAHTAGMVVSATMIIASFNGFLMASVSRMCGNRRRGIMRFCGFGTLIGTLMLFAAVFFDLRDGILPMAAWILMAFAGNVSPISVAVQRETNDDGIFGTVLSIGNCLAYLFIAIIGGVSGMLMEVFPPQMSGDLRIYGRNSYMLLFGMLIVFGLISAIASLGLKESGGKRIEVK